MSGLEDYARVLEARLAAEADAAAPAARKHRRHRRPVGIASPPEAAAVAAVLGPACAPVPRGTRTARGGTERWLLGSLLLLLLINALLYWKLYQYQRHLDVEQLHSRMSGLDGPLAAEWARLLRQHSHEQRGQLRAWRSALDATRALLVQTEQALIKLLETIKPSLEAPPDPPAPRDDL
ncbi:uncharacterized protein LOC114353431 [Ostrinia furnacalis]|uniref:uncharacterized protein LOC114353431 n=1 Tax=Ostrinia furnacalis TaxID=93504 RepID=UPI00103D85BE|nr:uncharacterized protein LOC114353431 [Ostrinia furnacalis]